MITKEGLESPQPTPPRRSRLVAALGAAAVLLAAIAAVAILVNRGSGAVAAAGSNPVVVFDGTTCSYDGPTRIQEGLAQVSVTNSAGEVVNFSTVRMMETVLERELQQHPVGTDWAVPPGAPPPAGVLHFVSVNPGEPSRPYWLLEPGTYLVECTTGEQSGGIPEHVWRVARVEVVAAG